VDCLGLLDYYLGKDDPKYIPPPTGATPIAKSLTLAARYVLAVDGASLVANLYPNASAALLHYLDGSGTDYSIDLEAMLKQAPSAQGVYQRELDQATAFAKTLSTKPDGVYHIDSRTLSQGNITKSDNADWFYAIGGYASWGEGTVIVCKGSVRLEFLYNFEKRYQWQVNRNKSVSLFGVLSVTDKDVGELSEAGYAKEYDIKSYKAENVKLP
jgi:hypothetical protein